MHPFVNAEKRLGRDLVELLPASDLKLDLKYSSTDNFMRVNLYDGYSRAFLHADAFSKFQKARDWLYQNHPSLGFLVYDALRPRSIQRRMYAFVEGSPQQDYVANPQQGSMHNFGLALDLTLFDKDNGFTIDMGTEFDDFSELAQPRLEPHFLSLGKLSHTQRGHRLILREAMETAGFEQLAHEWWHYNAVSHQELSAHRESWEIVE